MNLIYVCISALVICTSNKIVLVSRSKVWLCWGCARTCPCVRIFTAQVKRGSPAGEDSNGYGIESSKTVGTVYMYYGASSSSSLLSSYCSGSSILYGWIIAGFFLSEWYHCFLNPCEMYPVQTLAQPAGGRKQLFRDSGTKVENLNKETKWCDFHPVEELVKEATEIENSSTCSG